MTQVDCLAIGNSIVKFLSCSLWVDVEFDDFGVIVAVESVLDRARNRKNKFTGRLLILELGKTADCTLSGLGLLLEGDDSRGIQTDLLVNEHTAHFDSAVVSLG